MNARPAVTPPVDATLWAMLLTSATTSLPILAAALHADNPALARLTTAFGLVFLGLYALRRRLPRMVLNKHTVLGLGFLQAVGILLFGDVHPLPIYVFLPGFLGFITVYHDRRLIRALSFGHLALVLALSALPLAPAGSTPVPWLPVAAAASALLSVVTIGVYDLRVNRAYHQKMIDTGAALEHHEGQLRVAAERTQQRAAVLADAKARLERAAAEDEAHVEQLRRVNEEHAQLARAASQDLKQPLRNIASFVQLIERRVEALAPEREVLDYLSFVCDGAHRMDAMVDDLLRYCDYEASLEVEAVDLASVLAGLRETLTDLLSREGATLEWPGDLPHVPGRATLVAQLFQNLIANGVKFRRPGVPPVCRVTWGWADRAAGVVRFGVSDNGIGMPASRQGDVFGLFTRVHEDAEYEGTGIGLALCRRIVLAAGGEIWCESEEGVGTTFYFTWPLTDELAARAPEAAVTEVAA